MLKEINEKINKVKEDLALKSVLEKKLVSYKNQLESEEKVLKELKIKLEKEYKDVESLEKFSIVNLFATITNKKEEKLAKEEQEHLIAKLNYDEQATKVNMITENISDINNRLSRVIYSENKFKQLLNEKTVLVKNYGDENTKARLLSIESEIDTILIQNKEVEEALTAGKALMSSIKSANSALDSAKAWGTWDIVGGDFLSSMVKHDRINEAQNHFKRVTNLLNRFNKELGDVKVKNISFSSTTIAFDIFFDNIFTDFAVQNKINEALNNVTSLKSKVQDIIITLEQQKATKERQINSMRQEFNNIIEML